MNFIPDQVRDWGGLVVAAVLGLLGLRLHASRVNKAVQQNDAEAQHSSGLIEDLGYWRATAEKAYEQLRAVEATCARLEAGNQHMHSLLLKQEAALIAAKKEVRRLRINLVRIDPSMARIFGSEFSDLDDVTKGP